MKHLAEFADAFEMWMADWQKQMDKPLRIVSEMVEYEPDPRDAEGSDVRTELEVYKGR